MSDDNNKDTPQEASEESTGRVTPIQPANNLEGDIESLPEWAKAHIKELRAESKSRRLALKEEQEAQRKRAQEQLEQQGEYKKLADELMQEVLELRPMREKYQSRMEYEKSRNEARIADIPEIFQSAIPTDYAPDKLSQWLDANIDKLKLPQAPNIDAGAGTGGSHARPIVLTSQQKTMAKMANMTEAEYAAQLKARNE